MEQVKALAAPITDVFCARVEGTLLGIKGTKIVVQALYWMSVLFGTTVFLLGIATTGVEVGGLVTTTEILPMPVQVNFPVFYGCVNDEIAIRGSKGPCQDKDKYPDLSDAKTTCDAAHNDDTRVEAGLEEGGFKIQSNSAGSMNVDIIGGKAGATNRTTLESHDSLTQKKKDKTITPAETTALTLLDNVIKTLGEDFAGEKACFIANFNQDFKPRYDSKMRMQFYLSTTYAITSTEMYGVLGFAEAGVTDAGDSTYTYIGFQNLLQTFGLGIDEQVDATGSSWMPKDATGGKRSEVYRINSAIMPGVYNDVGLDTNNHMEGGLVVGGKQAGSLNSHILLYMDTFISRRTVIRNKSLYEIFMELGASFAASLLFITAMFKESGYITQHGIEAKVKIFRFQDTDSVLAMLKEEAKAQAKGAVNFDAVQGELESASADAVEGAVGGA
jgi:hypothetical protein